MTAPSNQTSEVIELLAARRIRAGRSAPLPNTNGICLAMTSFDLERFLDILVPPPLDGNDVLAARIIGRPQDLTVDDEPWKYEVALGVSDVGFEGRVYVTIPGEDVDEVIERLAAGPSTA